MSALSFPRQEVFARALAMDLSASEAAAKAGYANNWKHARQRAERPNIVARVTALCDAIARVEASDAAPMNPARTRSPRKASDRPSPAVMTAARALLAEAAKLNGRLEDKVETPEDISRFLPLSDEDWLAKYGNNGQPMAAAAA